MRNCLVVGALAVMALATAGAVAQEPLKSGLQVGEHPTPFDPLNVTGPFAGKKQCLVWAYGNNPVAVVFARDVNDNLTSLVKKIDATSKKTGIKSFVTFLSDDEKLEDQLKKLAEKEGIEKTALVIDNVSGPAAYSIAKDADVTVFTYNKRNVLSNHALRKGELNEAAIDSIMADVAKLAAAIKKKKTDDE